MTRLTLATVNAEIAKSGGKETLVKGKGYFYWVGGRADADPQIWTSIYVAALNQMSMAQWLEDWKRNDDQYNKPTPDKETRKMAIRHVQTLAAPARPKPPTGAKAGGGKSIEERIEWNEGRIKEATAELKATKDPKAIDKIKKQIDIYKGNIAGFKKRMNPEKKPAPAKGPSGAAAKKRTTAAPAQETASPATDFAKSLKKGVRVLVNLGNAKEPSYFLGAITKNNASKGSVNVLFDDGDVAEVRAIKSKVGIVGIAIDKVRKSEVPADQIDKWLAGAATTTKTPASPKAAGEWTVKSIVAWLESAGYTKPEPTRLPTRFERKLPSGAVIQADVNMKKTVALTAMGKEGYVHYTVDSFAKLKNADSSLAKSAVVGTKVGNALIPPKKSGSPKPFSPAEARKVIGAIPGWKASNVKNKASATFTKDYPNGVTATAYVFPQYVSFEYPQGENDHISDLSKIAAYIKQIDDDQAVTPDQGKALDALAKALKGWPNKVLPRDADEDNFLLRGFEDVPEGVEDIEAYAISVFKKLKSVDNFKKSKMYHGDNTYSFSAGGTVGYVYFDEDGVGMVRATPFEE
ncbi:hypothetical protein Lauda_00009 [Pseudomonas phage vB_PpuM-Lauda]